jgi:hypothetical protein
MVVLGIAIVQSLPDPPALPQVADMEGSGLAILPLLEPGHWHTNAAQRGTRWRMQQRRTHRDGQSCKAYLIFDPVLGTMSPLSPWRTPLLEGWL